MKIIATSLGRKPTAKLFAHGFALLLLTALPVAGDASARLPLHTQTGVVTRVVDGDTLWIKTDALHKPLKIRLAGIDAPEICQAGDPASSEVLGQRVMGKTVVVSFERHDDYSRALATVHLHGEDVGRWMVSQGQAWSYRYRRNAGPYAEEQTQAQHSGRGLFGTAQAENPRMFRKRHGSCYP